MSALGRLVAHVRTLWSGRPFAAIAMPLPFMAWTAGWFLAGERRWEHVGIFLLVPLLAYGSVATRRLFLGLYPLALLGLVYDGMRFVRFVGVTPERVHVCDLRAIDATLFGTRAGETVFTVHDWFRAHPSTLLDVICAVPYGTFLFVTIAFSVYLYLKDYAAMREFGWTFFFVNIAGFVTYHVYPAAPPWYFHAHGCAVDLYAKASEGPSLAHVDALLGVPYFAGFYGRSSDVFGAMPSLHVAYPMLILIYGWRRLGAAGRAASMAFLGSMLFAAVYLDHHWIVDILLGLAYTCAIAALVRAFARRRAPESAAEPMAIGAAGDLS